MNTIRLKRTAIVLSGTALFLLLCLITYLPHPARNLHHLRLGRHFEDTEDVVKEVSVKDDINEKRKQKVVQMMLHAWNGYKKYSWGANELRPLSKTSNTQAIFGGSRMPATIVDAADTLWIMGLKNEYTEARDYIKNNFNMSLVTSSISVFETTIRFIGGLLSLYALTSETFYVEKARMLAEAVLPAFNTPTGIPKSIVDVGSKSTSNYMWADGGSSILSEIGSLHLEFTYLSNVTGAPVFAEKVKKVRDFLDRVEKPLGLYSNYINPNTGAWSTHPHVSLGALGDSFYEYLIKSWIQSGKSDEQARRMYWNASDAIRSHLIKKSRTGLTYVAEILNTVTDNKMGHLACFSVGMFALQAVNEKDKGDQESTMELAEQLGNTCHESYVRTVTHIGPEIFYFSEDEDATNTLYEYGYFLRPEVIEGYFYLWRLTGKLQYREWAWDAIESIDKYCRVEGGFSGIRNVNDDRSAHDDVQQSFFLAETLKYAYLTFADDSLISLNQWVFNTEAHPLPVLNQTKN